MRNIRLLLYLAYVFILICLMGAVLFIVLFSRLGNIFVLKIIFILALLILSSLWLLIIKINNIFSQDSSILSVKYNNLENLLLDLRDGTKNFRKERRSYSRLRNGIVAKISGQSELIKVLDISCTGARLKTSKYFQPKDTLELTVYLPIFPQPIVVKGKVIWVKTIEQAGSFEVGIEYSGLSTYDREKLAETINLLSKTRNN